MPRAPYTPFSAVRPASRSDWATPSGPPPPPPGGVMHPLRAAAPSTTAARLPIFIPHELRMGCGVGGVATGVERRALLSHPVATLKSVTDAYAWLDAVAADPEFEGRCVHRAVLSERPARFASLKEPLHPEVTARLRARGFDPLYAHQAEGIDALRDGRSIVVATGTASGKSLCYQVPILSWVLADRRNTA